MSRIARAIFMIAAFAAFSSVRADPGDGGSYAETRDPVLVQVLDRLCFFPCDEYSDLKKAIAEYELRTRR